MKYINMLIGGIIIVIAGIFLVCNQDYPSAIELKEMDREGYINIPLQLILGILIIYCGLTGIGRWYIDIMDIRNDSILWPEDVFFSPIWIPFHLAYIFGQWNTKAVVKIRQACGEES
jgi:hypothetical protein